MEGTCINKNLLFDANLLLEANNYNIRDSILMRLPHAQPRSTAKRRNSRCYSSISQDANVYVKCRPDHHCSLLLASKLFNLSLNSVAHDRVTFVRRASYMFSSMPIQVSVSAPKHGSFIDIIIQQRRRRSERCISDKTLPVSRRDMHNRASLAFCWREIQKGRPQTRDSEVYAVFCERMVEVSKQSKRKSYSAAFKRKVVAYAAEINASTGKENGNRRASRIFHVNECLVRKWKKKIDVLQTIDGNKRVLHCTEPKWPDLEKLLKEWVLEQRKRKLKVSTIQIRLEAKRLAGIVGITNFKGGTGWCHKFMRRACLSIRATTSVGQHLPEDASNLMVKFRSFVRAETAGILPKDIGNMDEVPVTFDMPGKYTVDVRGAQDISITTTGAEKTNFTVVLGVTASGQFCPPMVIFKRKTVPKDTPRGIVVKANSRGWMNEQLMSEWIEECWMARTDPSGLPEQALLVLDSARCHMTTDAKKAIRKRAKMAFIPGGLTKFLQPLDISVNKSFKNKLRKRWEDWMLDESKHTYIKQGHMRRATYTDVCIWILESVHEISNQCIQNGFRRAFEDSQFADEEGEDTELQLTDDEVGTDTESHLVDDDVEADTESDTDGTPI